MVTRLVVVGGGRMGHAFLGGLLRSAWADPGELAVVEPVASARDELEQRYPGVVVCDSGCAAEAAVLAVKPADAQAACRTIAASGARRVLSIAAGVTLAQLGNWLGRDVVILRAMPNTPALIGAGASALAGAPISHRVGPHLGRGRSFLPRRRGSFSRVPAGRGNRAVRLRPGLCLLAGRGTRRGRSQRGPRTAR